MQGCWLRRVAGIALLSIASQVVFCQVLITPRYTSAEPQKAIPPIPEPEYIGKTQPASDWLVWRAFHASLQYYMKQSPDLVNGLLATRLGLDSSKSAQFLTLGADYIANFERVESEIRDEVRKRVPSPILPEVAAAAAASVRTPAQRTEDPPPNSSLQAKPRVPTVDLDEAIRTGRAVRITVTPGQPTGSGGSPSIAKAPPANVDVHKVLEQDGSHARFEERRARELQSHLRQVADLIGEEGYRRLNSWVDGEVRSGVRVSTEGVRVPMSTVISNPQVR